VQLENEHRAGWGTIIPNNYFKHLKDKAVSLGLQVPYFFSGLHSGNDPSGDFTSLDDPARPNPWFAPEYWGVWFLNYGPQELDSALYDRRTWKILAHGGNGYNLYMAHGGSNFAYNNDRENAASYDYGAAVGQTGDLRPIYYQFKRNALFARSFEDILENSTNSDAYKTMVNDTAIVVTARHSDAGDIAFFDHKSVANVDLPLSVDGMSTRLTLGPGEILPIVHDFELTDGVTLNWALARVLGISHQGNTTTMVVYGPSGSPGDIQLSAKTKPAAMPGSKPVVVKGNKVSIHINFDENHPLVYTFRSGTKTIRIIAVNTALADRTWFLDDKNKSLKSDYVL